MAMMVEFHDARTVFEELEHGIEQLCARVEDLITKNRISKPLAIDLKIILAYLKEQISWRPVYSQEWQMDLKRLKRLTEDGLELVKKCYQLRAWNLFKKRKWARKFLAFKIDLETSIDKLRQQVARDEKEIKVAVHMNRMQVSEKVMSRLPRQNQSSEIEAVCAIPALPVLTVGLDVPLGELKAELLKDEVSMLVVTAPGGYGKTTLATKFCHDQQVKDKFKNNIFFVSFSKEPNLELITKELYKQKGYEVPFQNGVFPVKWLQQIVKEEGGDYPLLLVLDDVRSGSESLLEKFEFKMSNYKILVTSRSEFPRFGSSYHLQLLGNDNAMELFHHTASLGDKSSHVPKDLSKKILNYCNGFPLAITVVGRLLCGQPIEIWRSKVIEWSKGSSNLNFEMKGKNEIECSKGSSNLDFEMEWFLPLQSSLDVLDNEMPLVKKCFLDLGVFPENAEIQVTALIDMWTKLYDLDEETICIATLYELNNRSLANLLQKWGIGLEIVEEGRDYSEYVVRQHDLLRELAIYHSKREPMYHRERLIIELSEDNLQKWQRLRHQSMKARVVSISEGEISSVKWLNMQLPEAEILVLNFQTKDSYALPEFVEKMDELKMLFVQNSSYYSHVDNFQLLGCLSNLTNITLDGINFSCITKSFVQLKNLHKLHLRNGESLGNGPVKISHVFPNLKEMVIDSCGNFEELPLELCELIHLTKLVITGCPELSVLPEVIGNLVKLEVLRLRHNRKLSKVPDSIGNLNKLKFLEISACQKIEKLPEHIGELKCLRNLSIQQCVLLSALPEAIENLGNLEVLSLRWCQGLSELPDSIRNLKKLTFLDIHECIKIEELPEHIGELKSLKKLQTTRCTKLRNLLQSVSDLGQLEELVCDDTEATEFFHVSKQNGDNLKMKNQFSTGLELANLLVTSDPVHQAWVAIEEQKEINPNAELSLYNEIQKSNPTIIAFGTPCGSLQGKEGLISSSTLKKEDFLHFEFLCNKSNSWFSINEAAISVFRSNYNELSLLKNELVQIGNRTSSIILTGSSVGGCVAILFTLWLLHSFNLSKTRLPLCITFGSPLLGDELLRQCVSEFTKWKSCFLHVASNKDPIPKLFLSQNPIGTYKPFGTFLLCSASGCACFEEPDSILEWLVKATSQNSQNQDPDFGQQFFDYGQMLKSLQIRALCVDDFKFAEGEIDPLQASIITQLLAIGFPLTQKEPHSETNSMIKRMERHEQLLTQRKNVSNSFKKLSEMQVYMASLEWCKKDAKRNKIGYYDMHKKRLNTSNVDVYDYKNKLMSYWEDSVAEEECKPHGEGDFFWTSWLMAGTSYRRMIEPLHIAEYYMEDGAENYITDKRPKHFILLEQWWKEREKPEASQNNAWIKRQVAVARLNEDSCFWAYVEEAIISCNLLNDHRESNIQDRESSKQKLKEFEGYVYDAIKNNEVSLDIFLEGSSFRQWWNKYEAIMGSSYCSLLMKKFWEGMGARSSPSS